MVVTKTNPGKTDRQNSQTAFDQLPTQLSPQALLQLSWSHLVELLAIEDPWKRAFFENECLQANWSVRQLRRQIGSLLYERTGLSTNKKAVIGKAMKQERQQDFTDLIRDYYVLEFTGLAERPEYLESDLESALLTHLQGFLLELGAGFCFEARQKRITVGRQHDYIDLVSNALRANPKPEPFPMLFPRHPPSIETPKSPKERRTPIRHASGICRLGHLTEPSECVSPLSAFQSLSFSAFSHILLLPLNPDYDPIIVAPHEGPEMAVVGEWVSSTG